MIVEHLAVRLSLDAGALTQQLAAVAPALQGGVVEPARNASSLLGSLFEDAFGSLVDNLTAALRTGKFSFKDFVTSVWSDLSQLGLRRFVLNPLDQILGGLTGGLTGGLAGRRAGGGPVAPFGPYLVGERGPELFRPAMSGAIEPARGPGAARPVVHFHFPPGTDVAAFRRSESQIAAMLHRLTARGARNL